MALALYDQLDPERFAFMLRRLEFNDSSVSNRWQVVQNALLLIQERPLFGIGFGQFSAISEVIEVDAEAGRSPHNFYLGTIASIGLLAASSVFLYVGAQARALWVEVGLLKRQLRLESQRGGTRERFTQWRLLIGEVAQAMFLFQTISLMFRGSKRVTDWLPVAMMSVTYLYLREQRLRGERGDDEQAEL
jgi:O-antigen ligase